MDESRLMTSGANGFQGLLSLCGRVVLRVKLVSVCLGSCGRNRFVGVAVADEEWLEPRPGPKPR